MKSWVGNKLMYVKGDAYHYWMISDSSSRGINDRMLLVDKNSVNIFPELDLITYDSIKEILIDRVVKTSRNNNAGGVRVDRWVSPSEISKRLNLDRNAIYRCLIRLHNSGILVKNTKNVKNLSGYSIKYPEVVGCIVSRTTRDYLAVINTHGKIVCGDWWKSIHPSRFLPYVVESDAPFLIRYGELVGLGTDLGEAELSLDRAYYHSILGV